MFWCWYYYRMNVATLSTFLSPILTIASVWNTGETGDIICRKTTRKNYWILTFSSQVFPGKREVEGFLWWTLYSKITPFSLWKCKEGNNSKCLFYLGCHSCCIKYNSNLILLLCLYLFHIHIPILFKSTLCPKSVRTISALFQPNKYGHLQVVLEPTLTALNVVCSCRFK